MAEGLADYLLEGLAPWGGVSARRMFGGQGLFRHGLMFGLLARDTPYFRVDALNAAAYDAAGSPAFTYSRAGRSVSLAYREVPAAVLDDPEALRDWAMAAFAAAQRVAAGRKPRGGRGR